MSDKINQSVIIPNGRVKFKHKINKKKQKEVVLSEPPLKTPPILGNGLKKPRTRYEKKYPNKRKIAVDEKNSNVNSQSSNPEPQHVPHSSPPEAENNNSKKNKNKTVNVTDSLSTEISVKSNSQSDVAKEETGSDLSLKREIEIGEHSTSKKRKHEDAEIKNKGKKKRKIGNHDIDRLDELILDEKKKKYEKKIKKYDIEDILFCENIDDSKEKKDKKSKNDTEIVYEEIENRHENEVSQTKKKKKHGNESNDRNEKIENGHENDVSKSKNKKKHGNESNDSNEKIENGHENDVSKTKKKKKHGNESNDSNEKIENGHQNDVSKTKKKKKHGNESNDSNEKIENGHQNDVSKTKKKKKHGNESNDSNDKIESGHENEVRKTKKTKKHGNESNYSDINGKAEINVDKESATNVNDTKLKYRDIQKKKDKIREILELGKRNNIKASGNNLRDRMLERLKAAKFRYLNEKLYTSTGSEAMELFQSDPEAFETYHEGYQQQLKKWPVNPLDLIVEKIMNMPASHVIADMGCGTASLAARVPHTVHSFDLVSRAAGVRACDMAHTPLLSGSVDVAVYCLALMGTQLTEYLLEANRILKMGGTLLIAEVESRFTDAEAFARSLSRLGFRARRLERRRVFLLLELGKEGAPRRGPPPALALKPCLYKKR